jgi:hypothetical protein
MFEIMVLVCLASDPETCFTLEDTWGPYKTREQCVERSEEMRKDILKLPDHVPQAYHCVRQPIKGVST